MAQKLLKAGGKRKIAAKKSVGEKPSGIVVVGNYKTRQLEWIRKNGVYNWPVREGDEFAPEQFARISELWLYANVKSERHVFSAAFIGKMTAAEFRAAYPTYAKLGASKQKAYYVFKAKPVDYPPELGSQVVLARAADFGGYSVKVKKAVEQFKKDGEFAPLAAYLPKELAKVPRPQLRVCEAAVQFDYSNLTMADPLVWSAFPRERDAVDQLEYSVVCINEFARQNGVPRDRACDFLCRYKGLEHLVRFYDVESTMPLDLIVEDLGKVCRMNGGRL